MQPSNTNLANRHEWVTTLKNCFASCETVRAYTREADIFLIILLLQKTSGLSSILIYENINKAMCIYLFVGIFWPFLTLGSSWPQNWKLHMFFSMPQKNKNLYSNSNRHSKLTNNIYIMLSNLERQYIIFTSL